MITKTVAIYVFFDDILKSMDYKEPKNRKTSDSEIMTVVLIAAGYFGGNIEKALCFVHTTGLMPGILRKSRFNRRMHKIGDLLAEFSPSTTPRASCSSHPPRWSTELTNSLSLRSLPAQTRRSNIPAR